MAPFDHERFLALFGVADDRAVGETESAGLVDDRDDPAGGERMQTRQRKCERDRRAGLDRRVRWVDRHARAPMGLPVAQSLLCSAERRVANAERGDVGVVPVSLGQLAERRANLGVGERCVELGLEELAESFGSSCANESHR